MRGKIRPLGKKRGLGKCPGSTQEEGGVEESPKGEEVLGATGAKQSPNLDWNPFATCTLSLADLPFLSTRPEACLRLKAYVCLLLQSPARPSQYLGSVASLQKTWGGLLSCPAVYFLTDSEICYPKEQHVYCCKAREHKIE